MFPDRFNSPMTLYSSGLTSMVNMMWNWTSMTTPPDLTNFDTSNVTNMYQMMSNWASMTIDTTAGVHLFNIALLADATNMMLSSTMDTATYDLLLVNWQAQPHQLNVPFHAGNSTYTLGGAAETARTALIADGWLISDGGGI